MSFLFLVSTSFAMSVQVPELVTLGKQISIKVSSPEGALLVLEARSKGGELVLQYSKNVQGDEEISLENNLSLEAYSFSLQLIPKTGTPFLKAWTLEVRAPHPDLPLIELSQEDCESFLYESEFNDGNASLDAISRICYFLGNESLRKGRLLTLKSEYDKVYRCMAIFLEEEIIPFRVLEEKCLELVARQDECLPVEIPDPEGCDGYLEPEFDADGCLIGYSCAHPPEGKGFPFEGSCYWDYDKADGYIIINVTCNVTLPNPCYELNLTLEELDCPECYEVRLTYNRTSDVCIQVIEERSVSATFNITDIPFVPTYLLLPLQESWRLGSLKPVYIDPLYIECLEVEGMEESFQDLASRFRELVRWRREAFWKASSLNESQFQEVLENMTYYWMRYKPYLNESCVREKMRARYLAQEEPESLVERVREERGEAWEEYLREAMSLPEVKTQVVNTLKGNLTLLERALSEETFLQDVEVRRELIRGLVEEGIRKLISRKEFLLDFVPEELKEEVSESDIMDLLPVNESVAKLRITRPVKLLGLLPMKMEEEIEFDEEKVLYRKKPWWSFLVFG